ncbi:light-inducible protein CPRF2 isoform X2 [Punica granatum]|uniref:Light-inducible protein CPRF2 isoform X2 n=1 Tax=Punica granatum TaxID=22663 RepID=A0A6P8E2W9_PUNGR|nr:light-inducible protein CPRF2 isoform X2 [Punica granatum]
MNSSIFSVDEIADSLWPSAVADRATAAPMSEWDYESFLQEVSCAASISPSSSSADSTAPPLPSNSKPPEGDKELNRQKKSDQSSNAPVRRDDCHAFLKSQLDRACAAVAEARSRASAAKAGESSALPENQPQSTKSSQPESRDDAQCASDSAPLGIPALPSTQRNSAAQLKQTTSESSREDSDDDELEVDTGTTENLDPAEAKRVRRMQSNRESARRSRRRKQEHMNELETQVGQLKVEHTTLLKRLTDVNQKYDEASVDNRILKADIETLRTKVKMAEETVKRVTGIHPLLLAMSNMPNTNTPFMSGPVDSFPIPPMPMQPNPSHQIFNHAPTVAAMNPQPSRLDSGFHNNSANRNPLPPAVGGNLQNEGEANNVTQISSMQNIAGAMPEWGADLPNPRKH